MPGGLMGFVLAVLPLGVDTFAIAAVVGTWRPLGWARWRISAVFVLFEGGMPLAGLAFGAALGHTVGSLAGYLSGGLLVLLGGYLCSTDDCWTDDDQTNNEDDEAAKARQLINARGLALIGLGLSISLDELAIGFGLGIGSHLTQSTALVAAIAIQTVLVSQLGLSLGARISEHIRERLARLAAPALICLGVSQLAEALVRIGLLTALEVDLTALGIGLLILAACPIHHRLHARQQTPPWRPAPTSSAHRPLLGRARPWSWRSQPIGAAAVERPASAPPEGSEIDGISELHPQV
ncbi:MAG: manganese efflux pump [Pseudonocardiaceae bacterium]